jgi:glycosyltransferase involved in cell wall biosynthesis
MATKTISGGCIVIPLYNHENTVRKAVTESLALGLPVIVVDDGSTDAGYYRIQDMAGVRILRHSFNQGKGAALMTGFREAAKTARWAITLDADGQHAPADALALMAAADESARGIVVGARGGMTGDAVPWTSRFGREFSNFWIWMAGGPWLADSQSGFRLYPLPETLMLGTAARRFQFEVEVLVRAGWQGLAVTTAPVSVHYQPRGERISHFKPFWDFMRNTCTFTRLICQRIFVPRIFRRRALP